MLADLDEAKEKGWHVIVMGDIWSMILPRDLKRFTSGRHGEQADAIINQRIDEAEALFSPYADNIDLMLCGNHETAIIKHHHIDPLAILIDRLNRHKTQGPLDARIAYGGYHCWARVLFNDGHHSASNSLWLHHGAGGGAPVTQGMIDSNRVMVNNAADVYVMGHKHKSLHTRQPIKRMNHEGRIRETDRDFLIVAGYSQELDQSGDYSSGYTLDYSQESYYGSETTGSMCVQFEPARKRVNGDDYIYIRRTVFSQSN